MRYLLDTNILIFSVTDTDKISNDVFAILDDTDNTFYVSSISIQEFIHLQNTGKLGKKNKKGGASIIDIIDERGITILPVKKEHLRTYMGLQPVANHNDPNDHVIISQAITERMPLISSDLKFKYYVEQRLKHVYNDPR